MSSVDLNTIGDDALAAMLCDIPPNNRFSNSSLDDALFVCSSDVMVNDQSATGKEYQGHIALLPRRGGADPSDREWAVVCTYGPGGRNGSQFAIYKRGFPIGSLLSDLNDRLVKKNNRGYQVPGASRWHVSLLRRHEVIDGVEELLR